MAKRKETPKPAGTTPAPTTGAAYEAKRRVPVADQVVCDTCTQRRAELGPTQGEPIGPVMAVPDPKGVFFCARCKSERLEPKTAAN